MDLYLWKAVCIVCALLLNATGSLSQLDVCGQPPLNNKIVGGNDASPGSWPWQVSLQINGFHFCGGSLINNQWVLSAAHCFQSVTVSNFTVNLGMQSLALSNPNGQEINPVIIIIHEKYNGTTLINDIALVQLSSSVTFNSYIMPACLAASLSTLPGGTDVWITGWGRIASGVNLPYPKTLQEVQVSIVSNKNCQSAYKSIAITSNMTCAGLAEGGKDSCQGDSGGPLVFKMNTTWVQVGIVSFGLAIGCALPQIPGVYTRVSQYQDWINSKINSNQPGFVYLANTSLGSPKLFSTILSFSIILSFCNLFN